VWAGAAFPFSTIRRRNRAFTLHLHLAVTSKIRKQWVLWKPPKPQIGKTNGPSVNAEEPLLFTDIPCSHGEGLWQWHLHPHTIPTMEVCNTSSYLAMVQVAKYSGCRTFRSLRIQVVKHSGHSTFRSFSIQVVQHSGCPAFRSFSVQITLTGQVVVLWPISGNRLRHNNAKKCLAVFWNRKERVCCSVSRCCLPLLHH
jgi:hypothetical protein